MALTPRVLDMADDEQVDEIEESAEESLEEAEEAEPTEEVVEELEADAEDSDESDDGDEIELSDAEDEIELSDAEDEIEPFDNEDGVIPTEDQGEMTEFEEPEESTSVEGDQESYSPLDESEAALRTDEDDFGYRLGGFGDEKMQERASDIEITMCRVAVQSQLRGVIVLGGVRFDWPDPSERLMKIHETNEAWTVPDNTVIITMPECLALDAVKSRQAVIVAELPNLVLSSYGDDNLNYEKWGDYESQYEDQGFYLTIEQFEALKKNKRQYAKKAKAQAA